MANKPTWTIATGNEVVTTLSSPVNSSDTSFTVASGTGFTEGYIIIDEGESTEEVVYVEDVVGNTFTIATNGRGSEGTTAVAHTAGATITDIIVQSMFNGGRTSFYVGHNADGTHKVADIIDIVYPVGSIYISVVSTNPGTLFGVGTWTAFGAGKTLVGLDSGDTAFDTVEETGGAKTHTLTTDEMPSHTHTQNSHTHTTNIEANSQNVDVSGYPTFWTVRGLGSSNTGSTTATNQNTGGGAAHNNLQPYIVTYMFKRIA